MKLKKIIKIRNNRGFTLIELMIVVAILGILAAFATMDLIRVRMNSNESTAKGNLKRLAMAMESYRSSQNPLSFPADFGDLTESDPPYMDSAWGNSTTVARGGYDFTYIQASDATYALFAEPQVAGETGANAYCVDESGLVYASAMTTGAFTTSPCSGGTGAVIVDQ